MPLLTELKTSACLLNIWFSNNLVQLPRHRRYIQMEYCRDKRHGPQRLCNSALRDTALVETTHRSEKAEISHAKIEPLLGAVVLHQLHPKHVPRSRSRRIAAILGPCQ